MEGLIIFALLIGFLWALAKLFAEPKIDYRPTPTITESNRTIKSEPERDTLAELREDRRIKEEENLKLREQIYQTFADCEKLELEVKGIYYRSKAAKEEIPFLTIRDEIKLRKEPANEYDSNAVKVLYDRKHLGYVPREYSKLVTELIDSKSIKAIIVSNAGDGKIYSWDDPNPYLEITVFYQPQ